MANYFKPGTSRYRLSVNYEFVASNQKGKRTIIGGFQSLSPSQSKDAQRRFELNTDGECIELTHGLINSLSISATRLQLNQSTLLSEFSGISDIESLHDSCLYFDVEAAVYIPKINEDGTLDPDKDNATRKVIRIYKDGVITDFSETVEINGDLAISESATIQFRTIKTPGYNPQA